MNQRRNIMTTSTELLTDLHDPGQLSNQLGYFKHTESRQSVVAMTPFDKVFKRVFDVILAAAILVLLLPVGLACAVLIRRWPAISRRRRVGSGGRQYIEYGFAWDSRLARKLRLTRLPVLMNIIKGNMSFVGPRPLGLDEELAILRPLSPAAECKPGLVCLWWIRLRTNIAYTSELEADSEYGEGRGWRKDLGIVLQAVVVAFYGARKKHLSPSVDLLGFTLDNITMKQAIDITMDKLAGDRLTQLCFVNADCVNKAVSDPAYSQTLHSADLCLADGIGMKVAGRIVGQDICENVNGTDWFPQLCRRLADSEHGVYLLGGKPGIAEQVQLWLACNYPGVRVCGTQHGYFAAEEEEEVIANIAASGAGLLLVAMGAPRQDQWIRLHRDRLNVKVAAGVGGLFDFYSGNIPRAPQWVREVGMEWFYRLVQEPRRMWRRYLVGNMVFLARVLRFHLRRAVPVQAKISPSPRIVHGNRRTILNRLAKSGHGHLPALLVGIGTMLSCTGISNSPKPVDLVSPTVMEKIEVSAGSKFGRRSGPPAGGRSKMAQGWFTYLGGFDRYGVPDYLLAVINTSLPNTSRAGSTL
jgi:N-acetylglucosaminyldiphosphoundecaprenol N-acetyl-beta-D-mannosaminyltransferase